MSGARGDMSLWCAYPVPVGANCEYKYWPPDAEYDDRNADYEALICMRMRKPAPGTMHRLGA